VRAVAFTGYASDEDTARARDAGFERHVCKPIDAAKLLDAIAALAR
jgi:CheY-like chemotaxis protein